MPSTICFFFSLSLVFVAPVHSWVPMRPLLHFHHVHLKPAQNPWIHIWKIKHLCNMAQQKPDCMLNNYWRKWFVCVINEIKTVFDTRHSMCKCIHVKYWHSYALAQMYAFLLNSTAPPRLASIRFFFCSYIR